MGTGGFFFLIPPSWQDTVSTWEGRVSAVAADAAALRVWAG